MLYPSSIIEEAVNEIAKLPGIGKKSALRLALHLLKKDESQTINLAQSLLKLRTETSYCVICNNISDHEICAICNSINREKAIVCVVEDVRDVLAIENTGQYNGVYHVLGGVISPMEGISPSSLNIDSLVKRASENTITEIVLALSPTMEGDTTCFYITKKLKELGLKITTIARGVPFGGELEYADELTLGRSIATRTLYENVN